VLQMQHSSKTCFCSLFCCICCEDLDCM